MSSVQPATNDRCLRRGCAELCSIEPVTFCIQASLSARFESSGGAEVMRPFSSIRPEWTELKGVLRWQTCISYSHQRLVRWEDSDDEVFTCVPTFPTLRVYG